MQSILQFVKFKTELNLKHKHKIIFLLFEQTPKPIFFIGSGLALKIDRLIFFIGDVGWSVR
jgi:hypothetical protein